MDLELVRTRSDAPAAKQLADELESDLVNRYGPGGGASAPQRRPEEFTAFLVALIDDTPVACGGVCCDGSIAEVHRMYTHPAVRGRGFGRAILTELERVATTVGCAEIRLETGDRQPEAIAVYEPCGYRRIPPYGPFTDNPHSVCFARTLPA
jgi:putative acetyltransferase